MRSKAVARVSARLSFALASIGFSSVLAQVLLLRELLVLGGGNEITLGLMLAVWLLWTALGGACLGRWAFGVSPRTLVAALEIAIALVFPSTIVAVRAGRAFFHAVPGELLGPGAVLLASAATLLPFCSLSGWLFAAATRVCGQETHADWAAGSGRVYLLEAAGSAAGGLAASLLLLSGAGALQIACQVSAVNLVCAGELALSNRRTRWTARVSVATIALAACAWLAPSLDRASLEKLWPGFRLVTWQDSAYGHLNVVEAESSRSIYQSGLFLAQSDDPATAEEAVHFALLQHPDPRSLLMIGGGINGSLQQALRHPGLERIDYVELDPAILRLAARYFPRWSSDFARVQVHTMDGRWFVKTTPERFDVILVNLPDPQTAQINRFYTREFFAEAGRRLNPGGVLSFQVRGSENYISPELAELLRCLRRTLASQFPEVNAIPGDSIHFFAATRRGTLTVDPAMLLERLRLRRLDTQYVSEYYLPFRLAPDRMRELEQELQPRADTRLNRDLAPAAYYFGATLWSAHFGGWYRELSRRLAKIRFSVLLLAFLLLALLAALASRSLVPQRRSRSGAALCVAAMGLTVMALELLLLLGFQAIYGYLYQHMAIIIAAFMAGMALGSWLSLRPARRPAEAQRWTLPRLQAAAALAPLGVYSGLWGLARSGGGTALLLEGQVLFPAAAVLCGLMGGYQFPAASRLYFREASPAKGSPAALYALDLAGACLGALLLSIYLVPVFGMLRTAALIAAANLALALAAWPDPGSRRP